MVSYTSGGCRVTAKLGESTRSRLEQAAKRLDHRQRRLQVGPAENRSRETPLAIHGGIKVYMSTGKRHREWMRERFGEEWDASSGANEKGRQKPSKPTSSPSNYTPMKGESGPGCGVVLALILGGVGTVMAIVSGLGVGMVVLGLVVTALLVARELAGSDS